MRPKLARHALVIGVAALWTQVAFAAEPKGTAEDPAAVVVKAPLASGVSGPGTEFRASNENATVAIKVDRYMGKAVRSADKTYGTFDILSFSAEAPIKKEETKHDLRSSQGWGDATALGLSFIRHYTNWDPTPTGMTKVEARAKICADMKTAAAKSGASDPTCNLDNVRKYLSADDAEDLARLIGGPTGMPWLWGVTATHAFHDAKYYQAETLAQIEERNRPYAFGIVLGVNPREAEFVLFKVQRKITYKDADSVTRCLNSTNPVLLCSSGPMSAPVRTAGNIAELEYRRLINKGKIGVSFIVSYDTAKDKTSVELPVYLMGDGKSVLSGGLRLAWNSEDRKKVIGLFVGAPFSVWGSK